MKISGTWAFLEFCFCFFLLHPLFSPSRYLHATYGPVCCCYSFWIGLLENFLYNTLFHCKLDFYFKFSSLRNHLFLLGVFSFSIRKSCPSRDARTQFFSMSLSIFVLSLTKTFFFRWWKISLPQKQSSHHSAWRGFAPCCMVHPSASETETLQGRKSHFSSPFTSPLHQHPTR